MGPLSGWGLGQNAPVAPPVSDPSCTHYSVNAFASQIKLIGLSFTSPSVMLQQLG